MNAQRVADLIEENTHALWAITLSIKKGTYSQLDLISGYESWRALNLLIDKYEQPTPPLLTEEMLWFSRQTVMVYAEVIKKCFDS